MADTPSRLFSLVAILIAVWVLVYWLYEPRPPKVTADTISMVPRGDAAVTQPKASLPPPPNPASTPQPSPAPAPQPKPESKPTPPPPPQVIEPTFRKYVVQPGDVSWEAIAQRVYGDRKMWSVISQANPMATSDRLKPGKTVLNIPIDPTNIQGKPNPAAPQTAKADPQFATTPDTTYVVQEGDTLWSIAKKVYGKGGLWENIYEANRDKIKNKDRPVEGTVLRIPPKPAD